MLPSPSHRFSPRELNHKRGRSLEGGLYLCHREKDDDLALFNEMQKRERENLLLHSSDDIDDYLSAKLKYYSDFRLSVCIPLQGGNSDLLTVDCSKNDYDWLLTPPETPLFHSLDDESHSPLSPIRRGRARSQPIAISREAMREKMRRSSRSTASPRHPSPSPKPASTTFQPHKRPSSAPHVNPLPSSRPTTPPNKPSSPASRSSSPIPVRKGTKPICASFSSNRITTSPGKIHRRNSASPRFQSWESSFSGFSTDTPPNLRTSLSDRSSSHDRGVSPASRNGKDSCYAKVRRQSVSPAASRSVSSSQSKVSKASSGDDDVDSLQSMPVRVMHQPLLKKTESFTTTRNTVSSKRLSKTFSAKAAPKRSFDCALQQMAGHKSQRNMFRPLLSNVPSAMLYVGKADIANRPMFSRHSLLTSSSSTSLELGASVVADTDGSGLKQDDSRSELGHAPGGGGLQEVLDKENGLEGTEGRPVMHNCQEGHRCITCKIDFRRCEKFGSMHSAETVAETNSEPLSGGNDMLENDRIRYSSTCSNKLIPKGCLDSDADTCLNCNEIGSGLVRDFQSEAISKEALQENKSFKERVISMQEDSGQPCCYGRNNQNRMNVERNGSLEPNILDSEPCISDPENVSHHEVGVPESDCSSPQLQQQYFTAHSSSKVDGSDGTDMLVPLKRSSSSKWPQGGSINVINIPHDDLSYARGSRSLLRTYSGPMRAPVPSVDLHTPRLTDLQQLLRSRREDMDSTKDDCNVRLNNKICCSGIPGIASESLLSFSYEREGKIDSSGLYLENRALDVQSECETLGNGQLSRIAPTDCELNQSGSFTLLTSSATDVMHQSQSVPLEDDVVAEVSNEVCGTIRNADTEILNDANNVLDTVGDMNVVPFETVEDTLLDNNAHHLDNSGSIENDTTVGMLNDPENIHENNENTMHSQTEDAPAKNSENTLDALQESASPKMGRDATTPALESSELDYTYGAPEEALTMIAGPSGYTMRRMTLEEATDAIIFCSSIVYSLAYEAASIAMEKNTVTVVEGIRPACTISATAKQECHALPSPKSTFKGQKMRHRQLRSDIKSLPAEKEVDGNASCVAHDSAAPPKADGTKPPSKPESKCNCTVM